MLERYNSHRLLACFYVIAVPAHCIVEWLRSEKLRRIYNRAGMVTPVKQVRGSDLMLQVCKRSVGAGYLSFLLWGMAADVVEHLTLKLRERFP